MESDEQLYRAARAGEAGAFARLYGRYERPLFGFLIRRVGCRQDAEELFQEAMLATLKGPTLAFEAGGFAGWLYTVAANLGANRLRHRRRASSSRDQLALGVAAGRPPAGADVQMLELERGERLAAAAARLSPRLAEVLQLRLAGKSYEDVAAGLGIPLGTVKSRVHLAVGRLRKELAKWAAS